MKNSILCLLVLFTACANPYKYALPPRPVYIGIKDNYYKIGPLPNPDSAQMVRITNAHLNFLKQFEPFGSIKLFDLRNGGKADTLDYELCGYIRNEITDKKEPRYHVNNYLKDLKTDSLHQNFVYYHINYKDFERKMLQTNMDSLHAYFKTEHAEYATEVFLPVNKVLLPVNQKKISPWYGFRGIKSKKEDKYQTSIITNLVNNAFVILNYHYPKPLERGDGYNYIPFYLHKGYRMSKKARKKYILKGKMSKTPTEYIIHFKFSGDKANLTTPNRIENLHLDRKKIDSGDYKDMMKEIWWYVLEFQRRQQLL